MAKKITASKPFEVYWESRAGHIYEVLGNSRDYKKDSDAVHALNMRTGNERILREKDFDGMRQLGRYEAERICRAEYGPVYTCLKGCWADYMGALEKAGLQKRDFVRMLMERDRLSINNPAPFSNGPYIREADIRRLSTPSFSQLAARYLIKNKSKKQRKE
jgi:hypothetical protein